jgi:hypothetical protein
VSAPRTAAGGGADVVVCAAGDAVGGVSAAVIVLGTLGFLVLQDRSDVTMPPVAPPTASPAAQTTTSAPPPAAVRGADTLVSPPPPTDAKTSAGQLIARTRETAPTGAARTSPPPSAPTIVRVDTVHAPVATSAAVAAAQGTPSSQTPTVTTPPPQQTAPAAQTTTAPLTTAPLTTAPITTVPAALAAPDNPRPAITGVVSDYARAIGTRQVAEIRRIYAGMTPQQQSQWESFFGAVRSIQAAFEIASLNVDGNTAVARITGGYEFVSRTGRSERQPASFEATFERDGDRWVMRRVR